MDQEFLKLLFDYNNGNLFWKVQKSSVVIGDKAGHQGKQYLYIKINKKLYAAHRLIFLFHNRYLPQFVDHIDGNKLNNRIENLREATKAENCQNSKISKSNKCGIKNVYWHKQRKKWNVLVEANGKRYDCGFYDNLELADLVAQEARNKYHKQFSRNV